MQISEGDKVVLWYNSGNRDESVFPDPNRFDIRVRTSDQIGFGAGGPHFCLGANLARREITRMFEELLRRLPDLQITGPSRDYLQSRVHPRHQADALRLDARLSAAPPHRARGSRTMPRPIARTPPQG